jgi:glucosamine 6-phosphate synthetase-like amidotransferase/phosphosugar isomerase protein
MDIKDKARIINNSATEDLQILLVNYRALIQSSQSGQDRLSLLALKNATKHKLKEIKNYGSR